MSLDHKLHLKFEFSTMSRTLSKSSTGGTPVPSIERFSKLPREGSSMWLIKPFPPLSLSLIKLSLVRVTNGTHGKNLGQITSVLV